MIKSILTLGILRGNTCTKGCYLNKTDVIIIVNISKVILNTKRNKDCASLLLVRLRSGYSTQSEDPRYLKIWKCQKFSLGCSLPPPPPGVNHWQVQCSTKVHETFQQITQKLCATKTWDLEKLLYISFLITCHFLGSFYLVVSHLFWGVVFIA